MHTANCGPLLPPPNGQTPPHTNTLQGARVTLICQSSLKENTTTVICNQEGIWEPNPAEICTEASGMTHDNMTNPGSSPAALSLDAVIAIVSSITVFVVSSILFLVIGFVWGHCFSQKQKELPKETLTTHTQSTLLGEDVQPNSMDKDLELKENVAYGTVH